MRRRGFTLTELMVVIGVIALLVAVIVPSMSKMFAMARATICQNNLNKIDAALATDRAQRLSNGARDGWGFQSADTWPGVPFNVVPNVHMFVCPEDNEEHEGWKGFGNPLAWMVYRNIDSSAWKPARNVEVCFADPDHQGWNHMNLGTCTGSDQYGQYIDIKMDDNSIVNAGTDGHDGWVRIYLDKGGKVVAKLMKYSCGEFNALLYCGKPLFVNPPTDTAGVTDPASEQYGWMGPGTSKNGMEVVLGQTYDCSYAMAAGSEKLRLPAHKVLVIDYSKTIVDPADSDTQKRIYKAARHLGRLNVLHADGAVSRAWPSQIDPTLSQNANLWRP